jgi:hypothetical protein
MDFCEILFGGGAKIDLGNSGWLVLDKITGILHDCAELFLVWEV